MKSRDACVSMYWHIWSSICSTLSSRLWSQRKQILWRIAVGSLKAELDIKDDLWFFDCHFKEDPVMPGCLGLDAMWQLVGFYLGWLGNPGKGRALGVSAVKFTGEVLRNVKKVTYEIDMKKIMSPGGTTVGLANGVVLADDKKIYSAESLKVGLFK